MTMVHNVGFGYAYVSDCQQHLTILPIYVSTMCRLPQHELHIPTEPTSGPILISQMIEGNIHMCLFSIISLVGKVGLHDTSI